MRERNKRPLDYHCGRTISARPSLERGDLHSLARRRLGLFRLLVISVSVVIIATLVIGLSIHHQKVQLVGVGASVTESDYYAKLIGEYFYERPFERFRPALNIVTLNHFLRARAPEIDLVQSIENNFLQATVMRLSLRKPVVMWESAGNKYYVDNYGIPFTKNYFADPNLSVVDKSGVEIERISQVANNDFLGFIGRVIALAAERNLPVAKIIVPPLTTRQIEVYFADSTFPVKMSTDGNAAKQVEDAARMLKYLNERKIMPNYVDVRVERRAYYK